MLSPLEILKQYWNHSQFRSLQEDIINRVLSGKDTLALMPTGGGKSICFQIPALAMDGVCIVISPLIALMKDQVEQLKSRGIKAAAIYSGMNKIEIDYTLDNFIYGDYKFLYVSPERLQTEIMKERTKLMKVCLIAVDEAHCVSAWGYDFRPPYLQIPEFRKLIPKTPLIALTATATKEIRKDIISKLEMKNVQTFQQSFARPNISYSAFSEENKERKMYEILQKVPGSAIIYARSRKRTKDISDWLNRNGLKSDFYHAGLPNQDRFKKQEGWIKNHFKVMVATNAFGMGIDKPDVRVVVHLDLPENLEAYYQEAGRAGRDGKKAFAVLLYDNADLEDILLFVEQKHPPFASLQRVYQALGNYFQLAIGSSNLESYDFDFQKFCETFSLIPNETHHVLKKLEEQGFIQLSDSYFSPSKFHFTVDNHELYNFQIKNAQYDKFIKVLLRMYGGELFNDFTPISEFSIARNFFAEQSEIEKMLNYLQSIGIANYQKQKAMPQLTFLTYRQDADNLAVNHEENALRKQRDLTRAEAVKNYSQEGRRCRMQLLQEYFDEITQLRCGVCDNCLQIKKEEVPIEIFASYRQKILQILPAPISQIADYHFFSKKDYLTEVLKKMIENEEIRYSELGVLERK